MAITNLIEHYDKLSAISLQPLNNIVFLGKFRFKDVTQVAIFIITLLFIRPIFAGEEDSAFGITNFAFASYLGTGFYTTSGQNVFVLQIPLDYQLIEKTTDKAGLLINLPFTVGLINFGDLKSENLPKLNDVTTITFLPGVEYQYPMTSNWTLSPFFDLGIARDINNSTNVLVTGTGIKSYYNIPINSALLSIGNKLLYAHEENKNTGDESDYSLIQTGFNYRVTSKFNHDNGAYFSNLYYINFYYPNNLVFLDRTDNPIRVGVEHEIGITFSNMPKFLFFSEPQLGLGVRFGNGVDVIRIVFGSPF